MGVEQRAYRDVPTFPELNSVEGKVEEYKSQPHTPELVTEVFQIIWMARQYLVGGAYEVNPCPFTQEELNNLEQRGRGVSYLPRELATQQRRYILGRMFPLMRNDSVRRGNCVTNDENPSGWFDYEVQVGAPCWLTEEKQPTEKTIEKERKLLSLNQYVVASQDNKLFTGQYLDEHGCWIRSILVAGQDDKQYLVSRSTWTELCSRRGDRAVWAYFYRDGSFYAEGNLYSDGYYFHQARQYHGVG